jgi:hypothetical protein
MTTPGAASAATVLILTPVKDAVPFLPTYFRLLDALRYPRHLLSIGFLESDSVDGSFAELQDRVLRIQPTFRRVGPWKRDFGSSPSSVPSVIAHRSR